MKKLYFLSILLFLTNVSFSQNLVAFDSQGNIPNGGSIDVFGMSNESVIYSYVSIVNLSASVNSVRVIRHNISIISGTSNTFCWGQCYDPSDDTSDQTIHVAAGDTSDLFSGEYSPQMHPGTSVIRYLFYNVNDVTDTLSVTINYIAEPMGIISSKTGNNEISNAYPNPAYDNTTIKYTFPKNTTDARLLIRDCLGVILKEQSLQSPSGKITVNLSDLKEGIYFYSVIVDNSVLCTRKLVVK